MEWSARLLTARDGTFATVSFKPFERRKRTFLQGNLKKFAGSSTPDVGQPNGMIKHQGVDVGPVFERGGYVRPTEQRRGHCSYKKRFISPNARALQKARYRSYPTLLRDQISILPSTNHLTSGISAMY